MEKRRQTGRDVTPVQPRLSRVLSRLQPNQLECIYGTDPRHLSQVHALVGQAAPLLILGDDAMGRTELARSLLLQLAALNDQAHLRLAVLERDPLLAPLLQGLPHSCVVAADLQTLLTALIDMEPRAGVLARARMAGVVTPPWVVFVCDLCDHLQDAQTERSLCSLIEQGHEWGIHVIALSQCGVPELHARFKSRITFAWGEKGCKQELLSVEPLRHALQRERQSGQFLLTTGGDQASASLLMQPLRDIEAVLVTAGSGLQLMRREVKPNPCSVLSRLLEGVEVEDQVGKGAGHVSRCPRCRHGVISPPRPLPGVAPVDCMVCLERLPSYYEATHPMYPLVPMSDADLFAVALHLGGCPSCSEQWDALVLLSVAEEEGDT